MAKVTTVFIVTDTELGKIVGVFDNEDAADECEAAAPGDRSIEEWTVEKVYDEEQDDRFFEPPTVDDDESMRDSYDDDEFYETDEDERDPYGD